MANQNLSPETQAIIDRLKAEGDLVRNSGTNSIRSVKFSLDRFEGIFNTISSNIAEQTDILRVQNGIAQDQAERSRNKEQFDEVSPQQTEKYDDKDTSGKLVTDSENKKINEIGDSIKSALSLKNIALAGAGIFVGYNLLKGFIDEKTGGGWTEFEKNIGPFARSLPETITKLQTFATELPATMRQTNKDLQDAMTEIRKNISDMTKEVTKLTTKMGEVLENFTSLGAMIGALTGAIGLWNGLGLAKQLSIFINRRFPGGRPPTVPDLDANGRPRTPPDVDANGRPLSNVPGRDPETGRFTKSPAGQAAAEAAEAAPNRTGGGRGNVVEAPGARAEALRQRAGQAAKNITDVENAIADPKMRKIYAKLLKGFAILGLAMTIYQAQQLAALLNDDNVSEADKIGAVGAFIGELAGGATLAVGMGTLGTAFGPWGTLIGAIIGGTIGSFAGGWLGEYVARWAFDQSPSAEDIAESRRQQGIDKYYEQVEARPTMSGHQGRNARRKWDEAYSETHNADGTPKNTRAGGGRGNVVEQPGERQQYMREQEARQLDALLEAEKISREQNAERDQSIQDIESYLGIERNGPSRTPGADLLGSNAAGGGAPVIINAPVNTSAPTILNQAGSTVSQISYTGGSGSAMGPSLLPYGITGSIA